MSLETSELVMDTHPFYEEEESDYVVLEGPFEHPIEELQEELLVKLHQKNPSAPPLIFLRRSSQHDAEETHFPKPDFDRSVPQNHVLFLQLSELNGSLVKFEAFSYQLSTVQDRIQKLRDIAWEREVFILLADTKSSPVLTAAYTGQNLSLSTKVVEYLSDLYESSRRKSTRKKLEVQQTVDKGTFVVATLNTKVCTEKETTKRTLLGHVNTYLDLALTASQRQVSISNFVTHNMATEAKSMYEVLLAFSNVETNTRALSLFLGGILLDIVDFLLPNHRLWMIRQVKHHNVVDMSPGLISRLFSLEFLTMGCTLEWARNDYVRRWIELLSVCVEEEKCARESTLIAVLRAFPFEEGVPHLATTTTNSDLTDSPGHQVLKILSQAFVKVSSESVLSQEIGSRVCLLLDQFLVCDDVMFIDLSLLVLCHLSLKNRRMNFLAKWSDLVAERVFLSCVGAPPNQSLETWIVSGPHDINMEPRTVSFLCQLATQRRDHVLLAQAVLGQILQCAYGSSNYVLALDNAWLEALIGSFPRLLDEGLLPFVCAHADKFFHEQCSVVLMLQSSQKIRWTPQKEAHIHVVSLWLADFTFSHRFQVAKRLFDNLSVESLSDHLATTVAISLGRVVIAFLDHKGKQTEELGYFSSSWLFSRDWGLMDFCWQILFRLTLVRGEMDNTEELVERYPECCLLQFVRAMLSSDLPPVMDALRVSVSTNTVESRRAGRILCSQRLPLPSLHMDVLVLRLLRLDPPQYFFDQVVKGQDDDQLGLWVAMCESQDVEFATLLLKALKQPFSCVDLFVRFLWNVNGDALLLPRSLACFALMGQVKREMSAYFTFGTLMLDQIDCVQEMLDMPVSHVKDLIALCAGGEDEVGFVPSPRQFSIFQWARLLLHGFDPSSDCLDNVLLGDLSMCLQFLATLSFSRDSQQEVCFGHLFFTRQEQLALKQKLDAWTRTLHLKVASRRDGENDEFRRVILSLANVCHTFALGDANKMSPWLLFSEPHRGIRFDRLCVKPSLPNHDIVVAAIARPPPNLFGRSGGMQPSRLLLLSPPNDVLSHPVRVINCREVIPLLKQSVCAIVDSRRRLKELDSLETTQFASLFTHTQRVVPVHTRDGSMRSQTVLTSWPEEEIHVLLAKTIELSKGEIASMVARFSPGSLPSTELMQSAEANFMRLESLNSSDDIFAAFQSLFAIDFCQDLLTCDALFQVWKCQIKKALEMCAVKSVDVSSLMLEILIKHPWRIRTMHSLLPEFSNSMQLVDAFHLVFTQSEISISLLESCLHSVNRYGQDLHADVVDGLMQEYLSVLHQLKEGLVFDFVLEKLFCPLMGQFLSLPHGFPLLYRRLLTNGKEQDPLPVSVWNAVAKMKIEKWPCSNEAAELGLENLFLVRTRRMDVSYFSSFCTLCLRLCIHSSPRIACVLRTWESWLVLDSPVLFDGFGRFLNHTNEFLDLFLWYARLETLRNAELEKRMSLLSWNTLVVGSEFCEEFLHSMQELFFRQHALGEAPSLVLMACLAQASFSIDFCEPSMLFLSQALGFLFKVVGQAPTASVFLLLCLPFERLDSMQEELDALLPHISPSQLLVASQVCVRNVEKFSARFFPFLFAYVTMFDTGEFRALLALFSSSKQWIIPYILSWIQHQGMLNDFCTLQQVVNRAHVLPLTKYYLPRFMVTKEVEVWTEWDVHSEERFAVLARKFIASEARFACECALQLNLSSRICNELGIDVDLRTVNIWEYEEKDLLQSGSALLLSLVWNPQDEEAALATLFSRVLDVDFVQAGVHAFTLTCQFARMLSRSLNGLVFVSHLADEVATKLAKVSASFYAISGLHCLCAAWFSDLFRMLKPTTGGIVVPVLHRECGWRCSKLEWLERGECCVVTPHSLPWVLDQVRFTLFPLLLQSQTQMTQWVLVEEEDEVVTSTTGDFFLVL